MFGMSNCYYGNSHGANRIHFYYKSKHLLTRVTSAEPGVSRRFPVSGRRIPIILALVVELPIIESASARLSSILRIARGRVG